MKTAHSTVVALLLFVLVPNAARAGADCLLQPGQDPSLYLHVAHFPDWITPDSAAPDSALFRVDTSRWEKTVHRFRSSTPESTQAVEKGLMADLDMVWHALTIRDQAVISAAAPCGLGIRWVYSTSEGPPNPSFTFDRGRNRLILELPCIHNDLSAAALRGGADYFRDDCYTVLPGYIVTGLQTIAQRLNTERPELLPNVLY